jgi:predicted deacylase
LLHPEKEPGEKIKKDEVIACIYNLHGDVVEEVKMPVDGYVWAYPFGEALGTATGIQAVHTGDYVAYVFTSEKA